MTIYANKKVSNVEYLVVLGDGDVSFGGRVNDKTGIQEIQFYRLDKKYPLRQDIRSVEPDHIPVAIAFKNESDLDNMIKVLENLKKIRARWVKKNE